MVRRIDFRTLPPEQRQWLREGAVEFICRVERIRPHGGEDTMKALNEIVRDNNPKGDEWDTRPFRIREDGSFEPVRWDPIQKCWVPDTTTPTEIER